MRKRTIITLVVGLLLAIASLGAAMPSDNDANRTNGWAHFDVTDDTRFGEVTVELVSTRSFFSCFEYRSDGEPTSDPRDNFNPDITDGLWPFTCVNNETKTLTLEADEYVEIRMVFGAESDERFDWTRVDVLNKDDCKHGGYEDLGFANQGQCIQAGNTGK